MDDERQLSPDAEASLDPSIWDRNLSSLRTNDSELAARMEAVAIPPTAKLALGRDGVVTFRIDDEEGVRRWFGKTSMPSVSGPALLESFDDGTGNVLLPGIGQGIEMKLLLDRLPQHRAVFVLEEDPVAVALALRLHDVGDALRAGRLVLLIGKDPEAVLPPFLQAYPGYLVPDRVLSWPWMPPTTHQKLHLAMERCVVLINGDLERRSRELSDKLCGLCCETIPDRPRCVVLGFDPSEVTARRAMDLTLAMESLNWPTASCLPDRPSRITSLAHGQMILDQKPKVLILVNHLRAQYRGLLPDNIPALSLFTGSIPVETSASEQLGPRDHLCVEAVETFDRLTEASSVPERIHHLAPAANVQVFRPLDEEEARTFEVGEPVDVAVIADGADLSAKGCGFTLPSHKALWEAVLEEVASAPDGFWPQTARQYLLKAEKASRVHLKADDIRGNFTHQLIHTAGEVLLTRILVEGLIRVGLNAGLWGRGWESHEPLRNCLRGEVRSIEHRNAIYQRCELTVGVDLHNQRDAEHLDALAAGALVLVRRRDEARGAKARAGSVPRPPSFSSIADILRTAKNFVENKTQADAVLAPLRATIASEATWSHRIRTLLEAVRGASIETPEQIA